MEPIEIKQPPLQEFINANKKLGILGGGQLGLMLCQAASNWNLPLWILDKSRSFPAGLVCSDFIEGDFKSYTDVVRFGSDKDVISIEIEHVNSDALRTLRDQGKIIHPDPDKLDVIKDKAQQKQFFRENDLPTSDFQLYDSKNDLNDALKLQRLSYPFVVKYRTAGYDGQGVHIVRSAAKLLEISNVPMVVEQLVDIQKELGVIVARNASGQMRSFPVVEMEFHPTANLVEYLICPARIEQEVNNRAINLAE